MGLGNKFQIVQPQAPLNVGVGTLTRLLTRAHDNPPFGIGISEQQAGTVETDLNYDEAIYMLEGDLEITAHGESFHLKPGDLLWMPRGHRIQYIVKQRGRFLYITSPAGPNS